MLGGIWNRVVNREAATMDRPFQIRHNEIF